MQKKKLLPILGITLICLYLILPLFVTFIYSVNTEWKGLLPTGFTLDAYTGLFANKAFLMSIYRTIIISIAPILICTIVMLLAMYVIVAYLPQIDKYVQIICTIPYAMHGIILAVGVLGLYANINGPLNNRIMMIVGCYCITVLPYIYQGIKNSLIGVNAKGLIEAAQMLGASKLYSFFVIIVPNIMNGIMISAMLAMAIIFGDFVIINTIGGGYFQTSQIFLYGVFKKSGQQASAIIIILFVVTLLITFSVYFIKGKSKQLKEEE